MSFFMVKGLLKGTRQPKNRRVFHDTTFKTRNCLRMLQDSNLGQ